MPQVIEADQRSVEWFAARLGKPTASRFNDITAKTRSGYAASRKNYMAELAAQVLTGHIPEMFTSTAMQWGVDNEPVAALNYSLITGNEVEETSLWLHDTIRAGASPDGLVGTDGLIEIKCPNTATHLETLMKQQVPKQYMDQVMGQIWITGRKWCDFVSYDPRLPENAQIFIQRVERDEDYITSLEEEITDFLVELDRQVEFIRNYRKEQ